MMVRLLIYHKCLTKKEEFISILKATEREGIDYVIENLETWGSRLRGWLGEHTVVQPHKIIVLGYVR